VSQRAKTEPHAVRLESRRLLAELAKIEEQIKASSGC
jgi:hypothetical protein